MKKTADDGKKYQGAINGMMGREGNGRDRSALKHKQVVHGEPGLDFP